ncbi:MAG: DUF2793 domain-containing protein [Roseovarius sp.]|nr:DUF2793 domain-containing protein [Roseovarius sp.]
MSDNSANLTLPYLQPAQAQKHITHNEALRRLDALVQLAVISASGITPPSTPADGDRYILPVGATGAWAGQSSAIAIYETNVWTFIAPREGWCAWVNDTDQLIVWNGSAWVSAATALEMQGLPLLGIQTSADPVNRLAVAAEATLLTHDGAGHQLKLNKFDDTHTASLLFQSNWSGRAEIGTIGSDDLTIKTSSDGNSYTTAMAVDTVSGIAAFPSFPRFKGYTDYDNALPADVWTTIGINNAESNDQGVLDTSSNLFTVPISGTYLLGATLLYKETAGPTARIRGRLLLNGSTEIRGGFGEISGSHESEATLLSLHTMTALSAGDTVALQGSCRVVAGKAAAEHTTFWATKIG